MLARCGHKDITIAKDGVEVLEKVAALPSGLDSAGPTPLTPPLFAPPVHTRHILLPGLATRPPNVRLS